MTHETEAVNALGLLSTNERYRYLYDCTELVLMAGCQLVIVVIMSHDGQITFGGVSISVTAIASITRHVLLSIRFRRILPSWHRYSHAYLAYREVQEHAHDVQDNSTTSAPRRSDFPTLLVMIFSIHLFSGSCRLLLRVRGREMSHQR